MSNSIKKQNLNIPGGGKDCDDLGCVFGVGAWGSREVGRGCRLYDVDDRDGKGKDFKLMSLLLYKNMRHADHTCL